MKKPIGAIAALSIVAAVLTATSPAEDAQATISWPVTVSDMYGRNVLVNGTEDKITVAGCYFGHGVAVIDEGTANVQTTDSDLGCGSAERSDYIADDGTIYGSYANGINPYFVAVKNGRIKWSVDFINDLGLTKQCTGFYSTYGFEPYSISTGADGNVYLVVSHQYWRYGCASYLIGLDYSTGESLFTPIDLGVGGADGGRPSVWTYDDTIVAVDADGLLHEYDYDMVEDTGAQYQFPYASLSSHPAEFMANEDGRFFMVADCGNKVFYYDRSTGNDGDMNQLTSCSGPTAVYSVGADGWLTAYVAASTVYRLDIPNNVTESLSVNTPSGYSNYYWQSWITSSYFDGDGNAVVVRFMQRNSPTSGNSVMVDYIEAGTNIQTNLATLDWDSTIYPGFPDYFDGSLYVPVWFGSAGDTEVHKIDVATAGFGDPGELRYGFSDPTSKLEYIAMGDSFSSGEGVGLYMFGTDVTGVNECHRSSAAYARWLDQTPSLNLHLTDFVACSGAQTSNVMTGQDNEPAQIDALSDSTDVVTISIGGNDVGFVQYATSCVTSSCDTSSIPYDSIMDEIDLNLGSDLVSTYQAILTEAPNATVYVLGYPQIAPPAALISPPPIQCLYFGTSGEDAEAAREVVTSLNDKVEEMVDVVNFTNGNERLVFIDPNVSIFGSFDGHDVCAGLDAYFNNVQPNDVIGNGERANIFHPNANGQYEFYQILAGNIE